MRSPEILETVRTLRAGGATLKFIHNKLVSEDPQRVASSYKAFWVWAKRHGLTDSGDRKPRSTTGTPVVKKTNLVQLLQERDTEIASLKQQLADKNPTDSKTIALSFVGEVSLAKLLVQREKNPAGSRAVVESFIEFLDTPAKREVVQALFKESGIDLSTGRGSEAVPQEQNMATLHLMVGLPCSGKTTYARQLAGETNALLLTLDVWHLKLFGHDVGQEHHDERHERIEKIMWDVAKHVLEMGGDVILDYGCWARVERDDYRNRAKELGADFKLHYMDVPYSELYRRLEERNRNLPEGAFEIPKAEMDKYITIFQPPTGDELVPKLKSTEEMVTEEPEAPGPRLRASGCSTS